MYLFSLKKRDFPSFYGHGAIMFIKTLAAAAGAAAFFVALSGAAQAAPVTYTQVITNAQGGRLAGAAIPAGATVTITANADTTNIAAGTATSGAGSCVLTSSPTVKVNAGAAIAITQPIYACTRTDGSYAGFYTVNNSTALTQGLSVAYTATTISLSTPSVINYGANTIHTHNELTGYGAGFGVVTVTGGDYVLNSEVSNAAGSSFTTASAAPAPVPTLSEWAMILLGVVLAGGAAMLIQRRRMIV